MNAMNSFLQTILIILLVYYGLKIVFKFLQFASQDGMLETSFDF